ncbi:MAG: hypothetical protein MUP52_05300 [Candidatus Aminicenantes bacterium]|nr:hypothetical protein [Candidatus Aminicenantes bacterium]
MKIIILGLLTTVFMMISALAYSQKIESIDGVRVVHNEKKGKWGNKPGNLILLDHQHGVKYYQYKIVGD